MTTKIEQLKARSDDADMKLAKNEPYYPVTAVDAVKGLDAEIDKHVKTYNPATTSADGLMSASDKQKLDSLPIEPLAGLKFKSPSGSIFTLSVSDDGEAVWTKEGA